MELSIQNVSFLSPEYKLVKALFSRAFPQNEQMPMGLLLLMAKRNFVDFWAFYYEGKFCGTTYTISFKEYVFVLYLAVDDTLRAKGYGSEILSFLRTHYENKTMVLNVEPLDGNAPNNLQRKKRMMFYNKNGFYETGYKFIEKSDVYSILSTSQEFSPEAYLKLLKKFSLGLYTPNVEKA